MKVYILNFIKKFRDRLEDIDNDFWDNLYVIDVEEVDVNV